LPLLPLASLAPLASGASLLVAPEVSSDTLQLSGMSWTGLVGEWRGSVGGRSLSEEREKRELLREVNSLANAARLCSPEPKSSFLKQNFRRRRRRRPAGKSRSLVVRGRMLLPRRQEELSRARGAWPGARLLGEIWLHHTHVCRRTLGVHSLCTYAISLGLKMRLLVRRSTSDSG
jgi:hypothetical protein